MQGPENKSDGRPDYTRYPSVWMSHTGFFLFIDFSFFFFLLALFQPSSASCDLFLRASSRKRKSEQEETGCLKVAGIWLLFKLPNV